MKIMAYVEIEFDSSEQCMREVVTGDKDDDGVDAYKEYDPFATAGSAAVLYFLLLVYAIAL